ncbi:MAG TPA: hypothetical protein EYP98_08110, partial [Planctomycetes bacterium]|nr:hypothetical protein [Planctomycetota bacterium]
MTRAIILGVLLSASCLTAQQVRMFGQLEFDAGQFRLVTPGVVLIPGAFDLANEVGQFVEVSGDLVAGVAPTLQVTSFQRADDTFELNGSSRIGDTLQLRIDSPSAITYYFVGSLAPGFTPLDGIPMLSGTVFVELPTLLVSSGPLQSSWTHPLPVPNNAALVGLEIWFQAAMFNGQFVYLNARRAE